MLLAELSHLLLLQLFLPRLVTSFPLAACIQNSIPNLHPKRTKLLWPLSVSLPLQPSFPFGSFEQFMLISRCLNLFSCI
jgi:hypothetical protein